MPIIGFIKIDNFRSIRSLTMSDVDDYVPILGLNSAGKSNVLRALNLFFNNTIDEHLEPLDLNRDFSDHVPSGKKKSVSVTVSIKLGPNFKVRGQKDFQATNGIVDEIYIRRTWSLGPDKTATVDTFAFGPTLAALRDATVEEVPALQTYIRSIRFVYVPNHSQPADLIRRELAPLQSTLVARLRASKTYKESAVSDLMAELGRMGDRMFGDVSDSVRRGLPSTTVSATLPDDFADLAFTVGLSAISDAGVARPPDYEGSGAQSFMLLHILDLADRTRRAGGFGWVQASIWAVEEPESFLHAGLRARFSIDLAEYSTDERRQILVTTHQDEFARVGSLVWTASKSSDGTTIASSSSREAIAAATRREITTFRHPLFSATDRPIVIVEGRYDHIHIQSALRSGGIRPRWRLISPSEVFGSDVGGDSVLQYLKWNKQVIASRPDPAPVIMLRDWEDKEKPKYDNALRGHPYSTCIVPPDSLCNPDLNSSFVGIERFLDTAIIEECVDEMHLGLAYASDESPYAIDRDALEEAKPRMRDAVESGEWDTGSYMEGLAKWIDDQVSTILQTVPPEEFF